LHGIDWDETVMMKHPNIRCKQKKEVCLV